MVLRTSGFSLVKAISGHYIGQVVKIRLSHWPQNHEILEFWIILDYFGLFWITLDYFGLFWIILDNVEIEQSHWLT